MLELWRRQAVAILLVFVGCAGAQVDGAQTPNYVAAKKVIDEAIEAKGGMVRLRSLKSLRLIGAGTTTMHGERLPVKLSRVLVVPDKLRTDATFRPPGAPREIVVSTGLAGHTGWARFPDLKTFDDIVSYLSGRRMLSLEFDRWRDPDLILVNAISSPMSAVRMWLLADRTVAGKACSVVGLRAPYGEIDVFVYFDKETKLVARTSYIDPHYSETADFSDYRDVNGVKFAYKRVTVNGDHVTTIEFETIEIDPEIDPAVFKKPAGK